MNQHQNFINGKWTNPISEKWIENINPATGELIESFPASSKEDIAKAGEGRRNLGMTTQSEIENRQVYAVRTPIGVVGAIIPWNCPMAKPAWKVMPALISGNAVILKPAEDTPLSANNLAKAFIHAGLPEGVLNIVHGPGEITGQELVKNKDVDLISFTGSTQTGTLIAEQCPANFTRTSLEMGGKNVMIILDDCNKKAAVQGVIRAVFATSGQRCTSAGRVIIEESCYHES